MSLFRPRFWKIPEIAETEKQQPPALVAELEQRLQTMVARFPQATFASNLDVKDMVITDAICRLKLPLWIAMLNTGKLNPETEALATATEACYQARLEVSAPNKEAATVFGREFGIIAMYDSVELRRRCYHIREVEPPNRALKNAPA